MANYVAHTWKILKKLDMDTGTTHQYRNINYIYIDN